MRSPYHLWRAGVRRLWRLLLGMFWRTRFEAAVGSISPVVSCFDRVYHRDVQYMHLDVARINALFPTTRRQEVAHAISAVLTETDRTGYFRNLGCYNRRNRNLPRGLPTLDDLHPPNLAALDFLACRIPEPASEVVLDFACGLGTLLVYARDLGFLHIHGFDNWYYLARSTAVRLLQQFGLGESVLARPEDLASIPATIVTCIGFPLTLLMAASDVWAKPSVRYVLADRLGRPATLPGFQRTGEYAGLLTIFQKSPA